MRPKLSYANVASTLALILGLTGVAWAATLPRNSVGTGQLNAKRSGHQISDGEP